MKTHKVINNKLNQIFKTSTNLKVDNIDGLWSSVPSIKGTIKYTDAYGYDTICSFKTESRSSWRVELPKASHWNIMGNEPTTETYVFIWEGGDSSSRYGNREYILDSQEYPTGARNFIQEFKGALMTEVMKQRKDELASCRLQRIALLELVDVNSIIEEYTEAIKAQRDTDDVCNPFNNNFVSVVTGDGDIKYAYDKEHWIHDDAKIPGNIFMTSDDYQDISGLTTDEILKLWVKDGLGNKSTKDIKIGLRLNVGDRYLVADLKICRMQSHDASWDSTSGEKAGAKKGFAFRYSKVTASGAHTNQTAVKPKTAMNTIVEDIEDHFMNLRHRVSSVRFEIQKNDESIIKEEKINKLIQDLGVKMPEFIDKSWFRMSWDEKQSNRRLGYGDYNKLVNPGFRSFKVSDVLHVDSSHKINIQSFSDSDMIEVFHSHNEVESIECQAKDVICYIKAMHDRAKAITAIRDASDAKIHALGDITI